MKKREKVSKIMTANVHTVGIHEDLRQVRDRLQENNIRHLPVVSGDKLVGILSRTDILRLSFGSVFTGQEEADEAIFDMLTIEQVMVNNPRTVQAEDTIQDVAEVFTREEFHALPVVDGEKLVGIVTTTDIIKYLLEQY